jgi:hypothetical protein
VGDRAAGGSRIQNVDDQRNFTDDDTATAALNYRSLTTEFDVCVQLK